MIIHNMIIHKRILSVVMVLAMVFSGTVAFAEDTKPFKEHNIPGKIWAVDFDNGGPGVAFSKVENPAGKYNYRSDATGHINIYADTDGGAIIGFQRSNWMIFTVNVAKEGMYDIYARYAINTDPALLKLTLNDSDLLTTTLLATGGWANFEEILIGTVRLPAGKHKLKMTMVSGGANYKGLIFREAANGSGEGFSNDSGPYRNSWVPCMIQAEDFDLGESGSVSNDGKNDLKKYRLRARLDIGQRDNRYYLALASEEAAKYTFHTESAGAYAFYAAVGTAGMLEVYFDDNPRPIKLKTAADVNFGEQLIENVYLDKGEHSITLKAPSGKMEIDYLRAGAAVGDYYTVEQLGSEPEDTKIENYLLQDNEIYKSIYVSPTGSDSNDGSDKAPFKTIGRAKEEVRKYRDTMTGDIVVNLLSGVYKIDKCEEFGTEDGGTNGYNVIYRGVGDEMPIISGGEKVEGWQPYKDGIWVAPAENIENTRTMYVDGVRAQRARSKYLYHAQSIINDPKTKYSYDGIVAMSNDSYFPNMAEHKDDVELVWPILWTLQYTPVMDMYKLDSGDWAFLFDQPYYEWAVLASPNSGPSAGQQFYIENALELLDEPGEFYFDKKEHKIYYYPYKAQDMTTAETFCGTTEMLIKAKGNSADERIENFAFRNIEFKYGAWNEASETGVVHMQAGCLVEDGEMSIIRKGKLLPAQVSFEYARNIEISDCKFSDLGSAALGMNNGIERVGISGNVFTDISADAISLGHWKHRSVLPEGMERCRDITVANNVIKRPGAEFAGSCGMTVYYTKNLTAIHNDISDTPYSGISLGWGWGNEDVPEAGDNKILNNKVYNVMGARVDGGHLYTLGPQRGTIVAGNFFEKSGDYRGGIYHDEGSSYFNDYNNVIIVDEGYWLHPNGIQRDNKVYDCYTNTNEMRSLNGVTVENITVVKDGKWPEEAQKIMREAGLEPEYKKNLDGTELPEWVIVPDGMIPNAQYEPIMRTNPIEAEDFNKGGEGVGYHKHKQENTRKIYRDDGVQLEKLPSGEIVVGNTWAGEWLCYDFNVAKDGVYDFVMRFGNARTEEEGDPLVNLYIDGTLVAEKVMAKNTGNWAVCTNQTFMSTFVKKGTHTLRVEWYNDGISFDKFWVEPAGETESVADGNNKFDDGIIKTEEELRGFTDINGHWAEDTIRKLNKLGIISGKSINSFAPQDSVSLYETIWLSMRAGGIAYDQDSWKEIAENMGIYNGEPDMPITRERFAKILMDTYLAIAGSYDVGVNEIPFEDFYEIGEEYRQSVKGAAKLGIITDDGDGRFRPGNMLTRAEAATAIMRLMTVI